MGVGVSRWQALYGMHASLFTSKYWTALRSERESGLLYLVIEWLLTSAWIDITPNICKSRNSEFFRTSKYVQRQNWKLKPFFRFPCCVQNPQHTIASDKVTFCDIIISSKAGAFTGILICCKKREVANIACISYFHLKLSEFREKTITSGVFFAICASQQGFHYAEGMNYYALVHFSFPESPQIFRGVCFHSSNSFLSAVMVGE